MEIENLIVLIIVVLGVILGVVAFVLIVSNKQKPITQKHKTLQTDFDIDNYIKQISDDLSFEELFELMKSFNENILMDDFNLNKCLKFYRLVLEHKNVNANIFRYFHKEVKSKNKSFIDELENVEMKALREV